MDSNDKAWMKGEEAIVSFVLEDVAQVIMQYYYFEKFNFLPTDAFTYFNAGFMIFTASEFLVRMIIMLYGSTKSQENFKIDCSTNKKVCLNVSLDEICTELS